MRQDKPNPKKLITVFFLSRLGFLNKIDTIQINRNTPMYSAVRKLSFGGRKLSFRARAGSSPLFRLHSELMTNTGPGPFAFEL